MNNHGTKIMELPCELIFYLDRHRKDLGDLQALAESIEKDGLLQPIGVTPEYELVFGERRLCAVRDVLKQEMIQVRIIDLPNLATGEFAENELRKNFTPSERAEIARTLGIKIGDRQGERTDLELQENFPEVQPGIQTREIVARRAGFGNAKTYEQAKKVVEKAVDVIVAQMDSEQLAISSAALIADEPPERQREIASMPPAEQREVVRTLRRKDLPTPTEAQQRAKQTGKAVLDRSLQWQTPIPMEQRRPLIERNHAAMAVVDAARALATCSLSPADAASGIREFDSPDMDFAGQCRKAAAFLEQITKELDQHAIQ